MTTLSGTDAQINSGILSRPHTHRNFKISRLGSYCRHYPQLFGVACSYLQSVECVLGTHRVSHIHIIQLSTSCLVSQPTSWLKYSNGNNEVWTYKHNIGSSPVQSLANRRLGVNGNHRVRLVGSQSVRDLDAEYVNVQHVIDDAHTSVAVGPQRPIDVAVWKGGIGLVVTGLEVVREFVQDPRDRRSIRVVI